MAKGEKPVKFNVKKYMFGAIFLLILGGVLVAVPLLMPDAIPLPLLASVMKYAGIVALVFAVLLFLAGLAEGHRRKVYMKRHNTETPTHRKPEPEHHQPEETYDEPASAPAPRKTKSSGSSEKKKRKGNSRVHAHPAEPEEEPLYDERPVARPEVQPDSPQMRYIPSENVYNFVHMGDRQSKEEKFAEIAKMDKTQFVIYVARLFSLKGYQVKFTPVVDNFDIDLLVEKHGVVIAVGCILTTKVLSEKDIRCIAEGSRYYPCTNIMALTNMYFDRTALDFAKRERVSLVDRNILAEDFMS